MAFSGEISSSPTRPEPQTLETRLFEWGRFTTRLATLKRRDRNRYLFVINRAQEPYNPETGTPGGLDEEDAPPDGVTFTDDEEPQPVHPPDLAWVLDLDTELTPDRAGTMGGWTPTVAVDHLSDEYGITDPEERWYLRRLIRLLDTGRAVGRVWTEEKED